MFQAIEVGVTGRAIKDKLLSINYWNPRDFAVDKYKTVDAKPYGGGAGMVMLVEPLQQAIQAARAKAPHPPEVIYLSPQGRRFDQEAAEEFAKKKSIIFLAGRYEGVDERIIESEVDEEWSIGDYVLTGGELPAMVMIDTITRLIPGVVGDELSVTSDSLTTGLLKYPQYTRPENYAGLTVPDILLSGHHQKINRWRLKASLGRTWLKRPDLLAKKHLTEEESALLAEFIEEFLRQKNHQKF